MKQHFWASLFLTFAGFAIFSPVFSQNTSSLQADKNGTFSAIPTFLLPPLENMRTQNESSSLKNTLEAAPSTFAIARPVELSVSNSGSNFGAWQEDAQGKSEWKIRVVSEGAKSLNFGFKSFHLPQGSTLTLESSSDVLTFTHEDESESGQLWTPILEGNTVLMTLKVPTALKSQVHLDLQSVNHGFKDFTQTADAAKTSTTGTCEVDVVCGRNQGFSQIDVYRNQIRSVGMLTIGGTDFCTGTLINNTRQDQKPLVLTAHHCIDNATKAASTVMYWNFQNSFCRASGTVTNSLRGDGTKTQYNLGAFYRASWSQSDFSLIELSKPINPSLNLVVAGWDRRITTPTSAFTIHHPQGEEKRISFENNNLSIENDTRTYPYADMLLKVSDWDTGYTEEGSSGAGLFNVDGRLVGQLYGGDSVCGSGSDGVGADWFGRIYRSWTGGGTSTTRLSDWLDPLNSGAQTLDLKLANMPIDTEPTTEMPQHFVITEAYPNPFSTYTKLAVQTDQKQYVEIRLFNIMGQKIKMLHAESLEAYQLKTISIQGDDLPNGIYFVQIIGETFRDTQKVVVLR
jgi:hypothetical protein